MIAQVTLTPPESKELIAKAVVKLDVVQKALKEGTVVVHPSSSTYFVIEEITGHVPSKIWVCGVVFPEAACMDVELRKGLFENSQLKSAQLELHSAGVFPFSYVIRGGKMETGVSLDSLLAEMGEKDVYIKGVNALDVEGNVGVLYGNIKRSPGGTIARVMAASRRKGFKVIFPVGLEKLIPMPVTEAAKRISPRNLDYSMGMPAGLLPCKGIVVTELDAVAILTGSSATPIACGGLGAAQGAVTMVIEGDEEQVGKAIEYVKGVKGAKLPQAQMFDCALCDRPGCSLAGIKVPLK